MSERRLSGIEMFAFDVVMEPRENEARKAIRRYGLLKLSCGTAAGWGVCLISEGFAPADLVRWSACFGRLRGLTPEEASAAVAADRWGAAARHAGQYALLRRALAAHSSAHAAEPGAASAAGRGAGGGFAPHPAAVRYAPDAVLRAVRGAAAAAVADREEAPEAAAGAVLLSGGHSQPDDMLRRLHIAAAVERPSSSALMDRADSYCSWF